MRNLKKFLALVLATLMVLSVAVFSVSAADEADYTEAANQLAAFGIMKGNENGDLMLANGVTRYQAALFFVQALTGKTDAAVWNAEKKSAYFADVPEYGTAIDYAYGINLIKGRGNGVYGYNDPITYQDMLVMAVRALGYETADMSYPYGYILAADKIGITNVDLVNYKAALTRGETAQIIFDMLNATVARIDPLTDKVLYENDNYVLDSMNANNGGRTTLLVDSGLAGGSLKGTITAFTADDPDDEDDYATVTFNDGDDDIVLKAADLGITEDTAKVSYLGLPVELFVSDVDDFAGKYEDGDAKVVFPKFQALDTVTNLGDAGNIKVTTSTSGKVTLALGSDKFDITETEGDYEVVVYTFAAETDDLTTTGGWDVDVSGFDFAENYAYDAKNGYDTEDANTYGTANYFAETLQTAGADTEVTTDDEFQSYVRVYYTAYNFGQFNTAEVEYEVTGEAETFPVIGAYDHAEGADEGDATPYIVEYYVDGAEVDVDGTVSETEGDVYLNTKFEGEEVKAGDFMFYAYNDVDNIVTVAKNCGTIKTGRVTGLSSTAYTAKIDGTSVEFGFAGQFTLGDDAEVNFNEEGIKDIISTLEAGKDNIAYLAVDGNIVLYYSASEEDAAVSADYIVIDLSADAYKAIGVTANKLTNGTLAADDDFDGVYVENGYVVVPMLNLTTGKYEAAKIAGVATEYEDDEYTTIVNVAKLAEVADYATLADEEAFETAAGVIATGIVAVAANENGVYTIAEKDLAGEDGVDSFTPDDEVGLVFNSVGKTNNIKATSEEDVDPYRVATNASTVIVAINGETIKVRTGMQTSKKNLAGAATFYTANDNLIVLETAADLSAWASGSAVDSNITYYVVLPTVNLDYGTTENDGEFTLTVTGLFDLKTLKEVEALEIVKTRVSDDDTMDDVLGEVAALFNAGDIVKLDEDGEVVETSEDMTYDDAVAELLGEDYFAFGENAEVEFVDAESFGGLTFGELTLDTTSAIAKVDVQVVTLDLITTEGWDWADYNTGSMYVETAYADADYAGKTSVTVGENSYLKYALDFDTVNTVSKPTNGVYNQLIISEAANNVHATLKADREQSVEFTVTLYTVAAYDEDTQVLTMTVIKTLTDGVIPE